MIPIDKWEMQVDEGWKNLIRTLAKKALVDLEHRNIPLPEVFQIKEKFGGLRFYYSGGSDEFHQWVHMAEFLSELTCEVCGSPGFNRSRSWLKTLCDEHA